MQLVDAKHVERFIDRRNPACFGDLSKKALEVLWARAVYGLTPGVSIGMPRARHIR
jgi:hypothetical protein